MSEVPKGAPMRCRDVTDCMQRLKRTRCHCVSRLESARHRRALELEQPVLHPVIVFRRNTCKDLTWRTGKRKVCVPVSLPVTWKRRLVNRYLTPQPSQLLISLPRHVRVQGLHLLISLLRHVRVQGLHLLISLLRHLRVQGLQLGLGHDTHNLAPRPVHRRVAERRHTVHCPRVPHHPNARHALLLGRHSEHGEAPIACERRIAARRSDGLHLRRHEDPTEHHKAVRDSAKRLVRHIRRRAPPPRLLHHASCRCLPHNRRRRLLQVELPRRAVTPCDKRHPAGVHRHRGLEPTARRGGHRHRTRVHINTPAHAGQQCRSVDEGAAQPILSTPAEVRLEHHPVRAPPSLEVVLRVRGPDDGGERRPEVLPCPKHVLVLQKRRCRVEHRVLEAVNHVRCSLLSGVEAVNPVRCRVHRVVEVGNGSQLLRCSVQRVVEIGNDSQRSIQSAVEAVNISFHLRQRRTSARRLVLCSIHHREAGILRLQCRDFSVLFHKQDIQDGHGNRLHSKCYHAIQLPVASRVQVGQRLTVSVTAHLPVGTQGVTISPSLR
eukprot:Rhum_TRINITY_DN15087_c1_g2::Rhum_TRINITY_DN15087_c1_g2_i3::g.132862::m.132862